MWRFSLSLFLACVALLPFSSAAQADYGLPAPAPAPSYAPAPRYISTTPQAATSPAFPSERKKIEAITVHFPRLGTGYKVLSPSTDQYNCIAWSLGITSRWVWPGSTISAFDQLNAKYGYKRLKTRDYRVQSGIEKIVLYGKIVDGKIEVTHQARQLRDGTWTSKLGKMALIRHSSPDSLTGPTYGNPLAVYYRYRTK